MKKKFIGLSIILVGLFFLSFMIGTYPIKPIDVGTILWQSIIKKASTYDKMMVTVVMNVRLPRILLGIFVGGALSMAGATYQTLFQNPMVSPDILGVSAGAGFAAALGMILGFGWEGIQLFSFVFGIIAVSCSYVIGRYIGRGSIIILILAGIVVSGFFQALLSIIKTLADTENELPAITFWLMGSLGKASLKEVMVIFPGFLIACGILFLIRYPVDTLSAGEEVAETMGVSLKTIKLLMIVSSTILTVISVSLCGIIGWIGVIIPHIARFLFGAQFRKVTPASFLIGAIFLLSIDNLIRGIDQLELPIGILTALIGTPFFILILLKERRKIL